MHTIHQPPNAELPYRFDWSAWLETGESIAVVEWELGAGLTDQFHSNDATTALIYLKTTGEVGSRATVSCTVTSDATVTKKDTRVITVRIMTM